MVGGPGGIPAVSGEAWCYYLVAPGGVIVRDSRFSQQERQNLPKLNITNGDTPWCWGGRKRECREGIWGEG